METGISGNFPLSRAGIVEFFRKAVVRGMMMRLAMALAGIMAGSATVLAANLALLVGIGKYDREKTGWSQIHGDKDVALLRQELLNNGFKETDIVTLVNAGATKKEIFGELENLAKRCRPGDVVLFHFSGHGQRVSDLNGDEADGWDEAVVPYDACKTPKFKNGERFYNGENHLIDDELNPLLDNIKRKIGPKGYLLVTVDACYSRGIEMESTGSFPKVDAERIGKARGADDVFHIKSDPSSRKAPKPKGFSKGGRMAVITACREDERNFQYKLPNSKIEYGSLSYSLYLLMRRRVKLREWERYFKEKEFEKDRIFCSEQHPKIVIYE